MGGTIPRDLEMAAALGESHIDILHESSHQRNWINQTSQNMDVPCNDESKILK